jgi:hypothetical protein
VARSGSAEEGRQSEKESASSEAAPSSDELSEHNEGGEEDAEDAEPHAEQKRTHEVRLGGQEGTARQAYLRGFAARSDQGGDIG